MRAPFQAGDFPAPVKYGYLNVGVVERGDDTLVGRTVFTLYPHQSAFVVPASAVTVVPDGVPARRAVLAGAVETAVNVLWDAAPLVGDRISVIGAGMIGCAVARLLHGIPGVDVTLVDVDRSKAAGQRSPRHPLRAPRRRARRARSGHRHQRLGERAAARAPLGGRRGRDHRGELVRRSRREPEPRRAVPLPPAHDPLESGGDGRRRAGAAAAAPPIGCRSRCSCSPTRRSTRC